MQCAPVASKHYAIAAYPQYHIGIRGILVQWFPNWKIISQIHKQ